VYEDVNGIENVYDSVQIRAIREHVKIFGPINQS
jgi:hypothetical protein